MKRLVLAALVPAIASLTLASTSVPAAAAAATVVATANYTIVSTCTAGPGCTVGDTFTHTYALALDCAGAITGTGSQVGFPQVQESVTGTLSFDQATRVVTINFVSLYVGPLYPGYTWTVSGTVDPSTGVLIGTAVAALAGSPELSAAVSVQGTRDSFTFDPSACSDDGDGDGIVGDDDGDHGDHGDRGHHGD